MSVSRLNTCQSDTGFGSAVAVPSASQTTATAATQRRSMLFLPTLPQATGSAHSHRLTVAPRGLQRIAVLAVHRRVIRRRQQQLVALRMTVGGEIHQHALGDLLVVRIVAHLGRSQCDALHQRCAVADIVEIGLRPRQALRPVQRAHRAVHLLEQLSRCQAVGATRRLDRSADWNRRSPSDATRRGSGTTPADRSAAAAADGRNCRRTTPACCRYS